MTDRADAEYDYIVVGSGAGGGPLASNLARAGMTVLLVEAGGDDDSFHYQVPCFHAYASEDPQYSWNFFVRHYEDDERQSLDSKFDAGRDGVLYPRAGTLGGCTAHNAMINVYPHDGDWDRIAALTGDRSWRSDRMRAYFERLERCRYRRRPRGYPRRRFLAELVRRTPLLSKLFRNASRHGYDGWLGTDMADPTIAIPDGQLRSVIFSAAREALDESLGRLLAGTDDLILWDPNAAIDPNDWSYRATSGEGLWLIPLATRDGRRNGSREYIKETRDRHPDRLTIGTRRLVTRVVFEGTRAVGVEYLDAPNAYRADPNFDPHTGEAPVRRAKARREVIVSGGAFNTPQLLKLSGVGPREELEALGIDVVVDRSGVGEGLQDRYEVGVVSEMEDDFELLEGATFKPPLEGYTGDKFFEQWRTGSGLYCSNGATLALVKKSSADKAEPDLFLFGIPASFTGYYSGYSGVLSQHQNFFTWAILKAHTENTGGRVTLRSADPRDTPLVTFRYFEEGTDTAGDDLRAMVEGIRFARRLMEHASPHVEREVVPGADVRTGDEVAEFVRREAWGHHASCTCRMGPASDPMAVVDSAFRVHGTQGLRVVDASVFPRIPGFFIVVAVYMISEKATDAILADVPRTQRIRQHIRKGAR